ncbi:MAG: hypothetical protein NXI20_28240 [bacterium]|nr:hypothetical protein [bacterium]
MKKLKSAFSYWWVALGTSIAFCILYNVASEEQMEYLEETDEEILFI